MGEKNYGAPCEEFLNSLRIALTDGETNDDIYQHTRAEVCQYIEDFLRACYVLKHEPFTRLREIFSEYEWKFVEDAHEDEQGQFAPSLEWCDFFWPTEGTEGYADWVFARHKGREGRGLGLCGSAELLSIIQSCSKKEPKRLVTRSERVLNLIFGDAPDILRSLRQRLDL